MTGNTVTERFFEPFTPTRYLIRQEHRRELSPGKYYLAVWDPQEQEGNYALIVGPGEIPGNMVPHTLVVQPVRDCSNTGVLTGCSNYSNQGNQKPLAESVLRRSFALLSLAVIAAFLWKANTRHSQLPVYCSPELRPFIGCNLTRAPLISIIGHDIIVSNYNFIAAVERKE